MTGPDSHEVLAIEGVSVSFAGRAVLDDVSFALRRGELAGLIGSNGAGKTTIFRVILGLQSLDAGVVRIGGRPRGRRAAAIGYVPQKFALDPDLPIRARDLVGLGIDGHGQHLCVVGRGIDQHPGGDLVEWDLFVRRFGMCRRGE